MRYSEDVAKAQPRASARGTGGTADICGHGQAGQRGQADGRVRSAGQPCNRESKDASLAKRRLSSVGRLSVGEADEAPSSALTPKHPIGAETGSALKLFPTAVYAHSRPSYGMCSAFSASVRDWTAPSVAPSHPRSLRTRASTGRVLKLTTAIPWGARPCFRP